MAVHLVIGLLILSMAGYSSGAYCVCKPNVSPNMMQSAIDYACGAGADCKPISPSGQCYNPNSITAHCSYAVNSYYMKNAAKGATCDFNGVATLTNSNPSGGSCSYSSGGSSSSGGSPTTTVPTTSPTTPTSTPITPISGGSGSTPGVTPVSGGGGGGMGGSGGSGSTGTGGVGMNPGTTSPYTASPNAGNGVLGGVGTGLAPTGSFDDSHASIMSSGSILTTLAVSAIALMWN